MPTHSISGGAFQLPDGTKLSGGTLLLRLTANSVVTGTGQVAPQTVALTLDSNGDCPSTPIWYNDQLEPAGTAYDVKVFYQDVKVYEATYRFEGTSDIDLADLQPASNAVFYSGALLLDPGDGRTQVVAGPVEFDGVVYSSQLGTPDIVGSGNAQNISIDAGDADTSGNGGSIGIHAGSGAGGGTSGSVNISGSGGINLTGAVSMSNKISLQRISAPDVPSSGGLVLWADNSSGIVKCKDHSGNVYQMISSSSGGITPSISFGGNASGVTYDTQEGHYTIIGGQCVFSAYIVLTSKGSSTGSMAIDGFPSAAGSGAVAVRPTSLAAGVASVVGHIASGGGTITLSKFASGAATVLADTDLTNTSEFYLSGSYPV